MSLAHDQIQEPADHIGTGVLGDDALLTPEETANLLRTTDRTLERWRSLGQGPKHLKIGPRRVAYRVGDVRRFIREAIG